MYKLHTRTTGALVLSVLLRSDRAHKAHKLVLFQNMRESTQPTLVKKKERRHTVP